MIPIVRPHRIPQYGSAVETVDYSELINGAVRFAEFCVDCGYGLHSGHVVYVYFLKSTGNTGFHLSYLLVRFDDRVHCITS